MSMPAGMIYSQNQAMLASVASQQHIMEMIATSGQSMAQTMNLAEATTAMTYATKAQALKQIKNVMKEFEDGPNPSEIAQWAKDNLDSISFG